MIVWMALALAAPPEGVDPDDFERWELAADRALDGPEGCWELTGQLRVDLALHTPATAFSRSDTTRWVAAGAWTGRLHDGTWERFAYELTEVTEDDGAVEVPVFPVIGRIDQDVVERIDAEPPPEEDEGGRTVAVKIGGGGGDDDGASGGAEAINLFQEIVDGWNPATSVTFAQWSEADRHIELLQEFPITDATNAPVVKVVSEFPEGANDLSRLDAQFPQRVKLGEGLLKVKLMDTRFHLRQQRVGSTWLPQVEGFTLMAGVLGFTVGYEQQLSYATAQACVSEP